jgi:hypothetical protein
MNLENTMATATVPELILPKKYADSSAVPRTRVDDTEHCLRAYPDSPDTCRIQLRIVKAKVVALSSCSLNVEEARVLRDWLERFMISRGYSVEQVLS